jgi:predicted nucleic acid-binding protein
VAEAGSELVRDAMQEADGWFVCRVGFVEVTRAVALAAGRAAAKAIRDEWPAFGVIEVDQDVVEHAATLAVRRDLRSLDAVHLAAALVLPKNDLVMATWDKRLHSAARAEGLAVLPTSLD